MKSVPNHFSCRNGSGSGWHDCTKHEICNNNLSKDDYVADTNDS